MNNKKYKHLFELDMLKAYYKLDHIEQIRLQDNYDLLKIYQRYVEETKSHPLEYAGDVGVIFVHDNFLGLSPFLYEMLRNGYFQNGDMEDFENMTLGEIIKIYEKKIGKDKE